MSGFKPTLAVLLIALGLATARLAHPPQTANLLPSPGPAVPDGFVLVAEVVDGDTIRLADGALVRYIGVDTPETVHPKKPVQCFGKEASDYNKSLVQGKAVRLVKDISDTDKYGRLLRYIYMEDGTFVNLALVANGYARTSTYPPDVAYAREFQVAMTEARENGAGLWGSCKY